MGSNYIGQRLSFDQASCTVRYIGTLPGTSGTWLGIEWDDSSHGKHDGVHKDKRIFECLSKSSTPASFIRPSRKADMERTLLEAIRFKYGAEEEESTTLNGEKQSSASYLDPISISGKVVEEVGFQKIQAQQSILSDLRIVLVDELAVCGIAKRGATLDEIKGAQRQLSIICPNITELDVGWNLIETWQDALDICQALPKLRRFKVSGSRIRSFELRTRPRAVCLENIEELQLNENLMTSEEILKCLTHDGEPIFPNLKTLSCSQNALASFEVSTPRLQLSSITSIIAENNKFRSMDILTSLRSIFPSITTVSLQGNSISMFGPTQQGTRGSSGESFVPLPNITSVSLSSNEISSWSFVDQIPKLLPNLQSLRLSRNPVYDKPSGPQAGAANTSRPSDTAYYLALARIPSLKQLNYTNITTGDREEGEIYYLASAERDIKSLFNSNIAKTNNVHQAAAQTVQETRKLYVRYEALCQKYERDSALAEYVQLENTSPDSQDTAARVLQNANPKKKFAPGTLGSSLIRVRCYISSCSSSSSAERPASLTLTLPPSTSAYTLKAHLARHFRIAPLQFHLIYESREFDPVQEESVNTTTAAAKTRKQAGKETWKTWGDWDLDPSDDDDDDDDEEEENDAAVGGSSAKKRGGVQLGYRWIKREIEIVDGNRAWSEFLDDSWKGDSRLSDGRPVGLQKAEVTEDEGDRDENGNRTVSVRIDIFENWKHVVWEWE